MGGGGGKLVFHKHGLFPRVVTTQDCMVEINPLPNNGKISKGITDRNLNVVPMSEYAKAL